MADTTDYMRWLIITAATEQDLLDKLAVIPGYIQMPLEDDIQRQIGHLSDMKLFYLQAEANGERIVVRHRRGQAEARTSNVMNQDKLAHPVSIWEDELVALRGAIKQVEGLSAEVIAAEIDLLPPQR